MKQVGDRDPRTMRPIEGRPPYRWQIELLFRWIKQHLKIRSFLGHNDNAIRLQIFAAMIAFALLRIAARTHRVALPILRCTGLVTQCLFERRTLAAIEKPPPVNPQPTTTQAPDNPGQLQLCLNFPRTPLRVAGKMMEFLKSELRSLQGDDHCHNPRRHPNIHEPAGPDNRSAHRHRLFVRIHPRTLPALAAEDGSCAFHSGWIIV